ncbi:hypothetical protein SISNIDRAFT_496791 [Sistotremastrum niveocremeum HHB9708]|uniref:F-box domain-containing protein n=1 Tax=Sistotremastrum niveocremeum HHB9708 TaxID=1314777 RepID=A0A164RU32_9AGAM|nr:hypothetical protein SISNIDRAFT_496791 [Sistotremastrum niveocremeum HHB9708]
MAASLVVLPTELILDIASYLDVPSRWNLRRSCRRARDVLAIMRPKSNSRVALQGSMELSERPLDVTVPVVSLSISTIGEVWTPLQAQQLTHLSHLHVTCPEHRLQLSVLFDGNLFPAVRHISFSRTLVQPFNMVLPFGVESFVVRHDMMRFFHPRTAKNPVWPRILRPVDPKKPHAHLKVVSFPVHHSFFGLEFLELLSQCLPWVQTLLLFNPRHNAITREFIMVQDGAGDFARWKEVIGRMQYLEKIALPLTIGAVFPTAPSHLPSPPRTPSPSFDSDYPPRSELLFSGPLSSSPGKTQAPAIVYVHNITERSAELKEVCPRLEFTGWLAPDGLRSPYGIVVGRLRHEYDDAGCLAMNWAAQAVHASDNWDGWPVLDSDILFPEPPLSHLSYTEV